MSSLGFIDDEMEKIKAQGLERRLRSIASAQGPEIEIDGRRVVNFCSNDYLGLAADSRLVQAGMAALKKYGSGSGSARLISGNFEIMDAFESELAAWKGGEAALLFNSGYHANIGVIPTLAQEGDVIFSDELNHASLIDGCRLSRAKTQVYRHNDLNHLETLLSQSGGEGGAKRRMRGEKMRGKKLIITESVFSMEGDLCPLDEILDLAQKYDALVYLDEAHAVGVFGKNGEGRLGATRFGARHQPNSLISMGTLGKAFGSYGAFVCGTKVMKDYFLNKARSFIFTTALPSPVIAAGRAALKIIQEEPKRRQRLWKNIESFRSDGESAIFSVRIGSAKKTMEISGKLFDAGLFVQGIRPPTVPEGTSRLRVTLTSQHTAKQIKRLKDALTS